MARTVKAEFSGPSGQRVTARFAAKAARRHVAVAMAALVVADDEARNDA